MIIGDRLRELREIKNLSQGIIEQRTGLLRCYISRVENGHTVPSIETLEKLARALEVPMYQLFYDGTKPPQVPKATNSKVSDWADHGQGARYFAKLLRSLARMRDEDRSLLFQLVHKMSTGKRAGTTEVGKGRGRAGN